MASLPRRYLAAVLRLLPAERLAAAGAAPPDTPFAFIEKQRGANRIVAASACAHALGIVPGLTLADARARVPELAAFAADPTADAVALESLAEACDRYTPTLATAPPDAILLDIAGCAHFHAGEAGLAQDLGRRLARAGYTARLALADTPDAALALARFGSDDPEALPIAALGCAEETEIALRRAGLKTLGAVAARPRAALAARFGASFTTRLDRVLGREDAGIDARRSRPAIEHSVRFAEPIATVEQACHHLSRLTRQACDALARRGAGGRAFCASLYRSDGHVARLDVETARPTRDAALVMRLLAERIGTLADPLDPGFGYDLVRLAVLVSEPLAEVALRLDGDARGEAALAVLLDRLRTRLGPARVSGFAAADSHIPERAAYLRALDTQTEPFDWTSIVAGLPSRPLLLLDPPEPVAVIAEVPDGPPLRFVWRARAHRVIHQEGPERIAAEWWRRRDGRGRTRDYYRVEDDGGCRYWLFRHGLYGTETRQPDWYLHGLFA
jgi:protein ImuB